MSWRGSYPLLQAHLNDPSVLIHKDWNGHEDLIAHSSISVDLEKREKRCSCKILNRTLFVHNEKLSMLFCRLVSRLRDSSRIRPSWNRR